MCVDEVHLFVTFGVTFCKEFTVLKRTLFCHLIDSPTVTTNNNSTATNDAQSTALTNTTGNDVTAANDAHGFYLKIPLLFMTATLTLKLLTLLQKMTGIKLSPDNYLWSKHDSMARRNIKINYTYTIQWHRLIKSINKEYNEYKARSKVHHIY